MSSSISDPRLLPANTTLLQPGSRFFRISDALNYQVASLQTADNALQEQITENNTNITTLQGQVASLQAQVSTLQAQVSTLQAFQNSFNYLQAEVSTGTIFLDQRTIYKRSFVINNALNTALTNFVFQHGIAAINYIVNIEAMAAINGQQQLPITFLNLATAPNVTIGVSLWADITNIFISVANTTFPNYQVLATLWYTATNR